MLLYLIPAYFHSGSMLLILLQLFAVGIVLSQVLELDYPCKILKFFYPNEHKAVLGKGAGRRGV